MLCKCHWIMLYTVHFTAFSLGGGGVFSGHGVYTANQNRTLNALSLTLAFLRVCG